MTKKKLNLDVTDFEIIRLLQANGRESYTNIATKLGVSDGTVRYRVERMMEAGYLRITASVDPLFFEETLTAIIGVNLEGRANEGIMERIGDLRGVQSVINVTGRYDLLVEVFATSRKDLRRFLVDDLSALGGVVSTEAFMYLEAVNKWVERP